jgi:hypothetical protein
MAAAQLFEATANRTMVSVVGGALNIGDSNEKNALGGILLVVLGDEWSAKKIKIERAMRPQISMASAVYERMQQPTESRPYC